MFFKPILSKMGVVFAKKLGYNGLDHKKNLKKE